MTVGEHAGATVAGPRIPSVAWQRGIGVPCDSVGSPRVSQPMIDDREWAGVPIGGLGTGSIGRTYRGDFARWHMEVGRHRFHPVAADAFSVFVGGAGHPGRATVLSALRPPALPGWGPFLAPGDGTYHALFPRAWQTFEPGLLGVGLVGEQLSPVIAGDLDASALPVAVYEWWIDNPQAEPVTVGLMLSWQDPSADPTVPAPPGAWHEACSSSDASGVVLHAPDASPTGLRGTFALAVDRGAGIDVSVRTRFDALADVETWADFAEDGRLEPLDDRRPSGDGEAIGAAVAATVWLQPGERRSVRFAIAWDYPMVEFGAGRRWWKRYTRSWGRGGTRAWDLARHALDRTAAWRASIDAWQRPVVEDPERPAWYRAALFNELYLFVDGGTFWEAGEVEGPEPDPADPGRFAMLECFDYPFYDTVDVDFYASCAVLATFPELEARGIRDVIEAVPDGDPAIVTLEASGAPAVRKEPWTVPHDLGGPDDDPFRRPNRYRFQDVNRWKDLAPKLVLQAWRDAVAMADRSLVETALPTLERVIARLEAADIDGDGLPDHEGIPDQTFDTWPMSGPSAYGGCLYLGALAALEAMARQIGAGAEAAAFTARRDRARAAFERRLWRGSYYAYDDGGRASSDTVMADQLAGQWYADVTGLGDLVAADRIITTLRTIHRLNVRSFHGGRMGAVNGMRPDGTVDDSSEQSAEVWIGTTYALAALMIGRGLVDEGWETARGAAAVTYERGLWFRTPEAYDGNGNFRAPLYMRPLAIWAIEEALARLRRE
jgi:non-lysosomal glucosylceramidase